MKWKWKRPALPEKRKIALITKLSLVEGEILTYLEKRGVARLRRIVYDLEWPMAEVMMAVGALIRERLVEIRQDRFGVFLAAC